MNGTRMLLLLLTIAAGVYGVTRLVVGGDSGEKSPAGSQAERVKQVLTRQVATNDIACMRETFTFPFSTRESRGMHCDRCEDLYQAGLLSKSVEEYKEFGRTAFDTRFALTNLGASVYEERVYAVGGNKVGKICFGKAVLYRIDEMLSPMNFNGETIYGITYTLELLNQNPFIFDPRSKVLNVEAPTPGTPALYAPRITSVMLSPGGGYVDDSFRYGRYLNK